MYGKRNRNSRDPGRDGAVVDSIDITSYSLADLEEWVQDMEARGYTVTLKRRLTPAVAGRPVEAETG
ncbi:MAG TPA: hypothetical protein VEI04_05715 [Syntrophobacteria bacterium]|nr:hypothetical protein [Syntrophobacteria bacterium]